MKLVSSFMVFFFVIGASSAIIEEGRALYSVGRLKEAEVLFKKTRNEDGGAFISEVYLGLIQIKKNNVQKALDFFISAADSPDLKIASAAFHNSGYIYHNRARAAKGGTRKTKLYTSAHEAYKKSLIRMYDPKTASNFEAVKIEMEKQFPDVKTAKADKKEELSSAEKLTESHLREIRQFYIDVNPRVFIP